MGTRDLAGIRPRSKSDHGTSLNNQGVSSLGFEEARFLSVPRKQSRAHSASSAEIQQARRCTKKLATKELLRLLRYLMKTEAYVTEGIFRQSGNYSNINHAKKQLLGPNSTSTKEAREIYSQLGPVACGELFKEILSIASPLIDSSSYALIKDAPSLQCLNSSEMQHSSSEVISLYLGSILALNSRRESRLILRSMELLRKTIGAKDQSRMSLTNIAAIFTTLFFGAPTTTEITQFMEENTERSRTLEYLLCMHQLHPDYFLERSCRPERLEAGRSVNVGDGYIIRGERVHIFYRDVKYAYLRAGHHIYQLSSTDLLKTFQVPAIRETFSLAPLSKQRSSLSVKKERSRSTPDAGNGVNTTSPKRRAVASLKSLRNGRLLSPKEKNGRKRSTPPLD